MKRCNSISIKFKSRFALLLPVWFGLSCLKVSVDSLEANSIMRIVLACIIDQLLSLNY